MRDRREPWKWPAAIGLTLGIILVAGLWLPRSWLGFLLPTASPGERGPGRAARRWLVLQPPPEIEVLVGPAPDPVPRPDPPPTTDPDWWRGGWAVDARRDPALFEPPPAVADSVDLLLGELGLGRDFLARVRPDSVLAARLFVLRLTDGFRYDELKPLLLHMARAEAYADILAKAADMYDEPLAREIRVPD